MKSLSLRYSLVLTLDMKFKHHNPTSRLLVLKSTLRSTSFQGRKSVAI